MKLKSYFENGDLIGKQYTGEGNDLTIAWPGSTNPPSCSSSRRESDYR